MTDRWSDWQLYSDWQPDLDSFKETLDGGQAFCWHETDEVTFQGVVLSTPLRLRWHPNKEIAWSTTEKQEKQAGELLAKYLGNNKTYRNYYDTLPWRSDSHLKRCMDELPALRILRQPHGETLLAFLCSATKQIVQIKEMLNLLRAGFGTQLPSGHKALPTWDQLLQVEEAALRDCKCGFRAANISKTAKLLMEGEVTLGSITSLPYNEAKENLCTLPGVGEKIADCVLLFGYNHMQAFPVDTWILKVMQRHYQLDDWTPKKVSHFGRKHFGKYAGLAQQFLFSWERKQARK